VFGVLVPLYTYLTMTVGKRASENFLLDPARENQIGRGTECTVVLSDPLCSRVHAVLVHTSGTWHVRDFESRNGTFVNGQKIDEASLAPGNHIRVGSTEFSFQQSSQPPTSTGTSDPSITQTLVKEALVSTGNTANLALGALQDHEQAHDLLLLYELSIKLLGYAVPDEVVRVALELLRDRCGASLVAFLWVSDDGRLTPKMFLPEQPLRDLPLSESLTHLVLTEKHAIWIASQRGGGTTDETLRHYADALCVPLLNKGTVVGAIHAYLDQGRFRQSQFDFAISLANIASVALVRARHDATLETDLRRLKEKSAGFDELIGESPPMRDLKSKINRLGHATGCVLVRGESGAGKELVARALHRASTRADRPMLSVNCAAIPADLMESQLFGHKAGSFTGADRDHVGYFQQADLGTLFLDEVGEMTLQGQAKLLRILEGHPFLPVGANEEIRVDVRIIAATNQDLQAYVRERKFREDLYYRLSVFELAVPPLRDRGSDVGTLIDFFLEHFRHQHGRPRLELSDEARRRLLGYNWPGNVRQLRNVIDSSVVLAAGDRIEPDDLGLRDPHGGGGFDTLRIDDWERRLIREALDRSDGNMPEAAKLLGIGRATLYRKVEEYGIDRK